MSLGVAAVVDEATGVGCTCGCGVSLSGVALAGETLAAGDFSTAAGAELESSY